KGLRVHEWLKTSERQVHEGVQLTTLRNAVAALVGAAMGSVPERDRLHDYPAFRDYSKVSLRNAMQRSRAAE
ncbi:hypothetical protein LTR95_015829, partial [Oleoguttula sp. CCFEE 5521]